MSRTSITLVAIALGLLGFILLFERGSTSTSEREMRKGRVLTSFVRARVTSVELQRHGVTTRLVHVPANEKDPLDLGGWEVQSPYQAKADSTEVDSLLGALEWADARRSLGVASPQDLKQFGLDAPRYRVRYKVGRDEVGFSVGIAAVDGSGAYLKRSDSDEVYVVGSELLDALAREPNDYHSKNLHDGLTVLTLEMLSLQGGASPERKLVKRDGFFWIDSPISALASATEVKALVDGLDALRAVRYVAEKALPEHGLASPRLAVGLDSLVYDPDPAHKGQRKTERFRLSIGASCGAHADELYVQLGEGSVYCAAKAELDKLDRSAERLREVRLLPLDDDEIAAVVLSDNDRELSLETKDNVTRYRLTQGAVEQSSGTADPEALKRWYAALRAVQIEAFESVDAAGVAAVAGSSQRATFTRTGKDAAPYVVQVDGSKRAAVRLSESTRLRLPDQAAVLLAPIAARYRAKRVLSEDESQLSALVITRAGDAAPERVQRSAAGYEVVSPVKAPAARNTVDELARLLSGLDALDFESDVATPEHGLAPGYRTVRIEYAPEPTDPAKARVHTLVIGAKRGTAGRYAQLDSDPAVFVLADALVSALEQPLLAPTAISLPQARLRRLSLHTGSSHATVVPQGGGYAFEGSGADSAASAQKLIMLLAGLKAERVEAYGATAPVTPARLELTAQLVTPDEVVRYSFYEAKGGADSHPVIVLRRLDMPVNWVLSAATSQALMDAVLGARKAGGAH